MFPNSYDPPTLSLLTRVFDVAWKDVQGMIGVANPITAEALRSKLATRLITAVDRGERDPARLKLIALDVVQA